MAQGGVDERAGSGASQRRAALAGRPARAGMGVGFVFVGRAGGGRGAAAAMVSGVLLLFGKVGVWPQPDGGARRAGPPFFHRGHAAGAGPSDAGQRPAPPAPAVWRGQLLE